MNNIFQQNNLVSKQERELRFGTKGAVVWLTGLSGSGKSTIAVKAEKMLTDKGCRCYLLDGDNIRMGLNADLGFSDADRTENIRRISHVAALLAHSGCVCFVSAISPFATDREQAKKVLLKLSELVSTRLRKHEFLAGNATVEIKYADFTKCSHQAPFLTPTNATSKIYGLSCELFDELWNGAPIRLLGIRTSKLQDVGEPVQMSLFDMELPKVEKQKVVEQKGPSIEKLEKLDKAMDFIKKRFGNDAIVRGSALMKDKQPPSAQEE